MNKKEINEHIISYHSMQVVNMVNKFFEVNPQELLTQRDYENIHTVAWQEAKKKFNLNNYNK